MNDITTIHDYRCDLNTGPCVADLRTPLMHQDNRADIFRVAVSRNSEPVDLTGMTMYTYVYLTSTRQTRALGGTIDGHYAMVTLDESCYARPGLVSISIQLEADGGVRHTVLKVNALVCRTGSEALVSGGLLPSLPELLELIDGGTTTGNVIPSYWLTHLNERIPAIRAAMTAAGWKKSAFLWYHDVHWTYGYKKAPMLLKYLYEHTPINKTMFGGDVVDNEGDTSTMTYLWDWRDAVRDVPNHHSVPGNHDDGNTTDNLWDDPYIYAYLLAAEETPDVVRGDAGLYYYIDDPTEKTRYLYIDTATKDGNIINDTAEQAWLVESLKSTPAGWHIVAIAHIWRTVDYDASPPADAGWSYGGAYCIGEFDKYNARTGEYASCTGKVEFCIGGHTHVDADFVSDGGIPVILTECDSRYVRSSLECTEGTITESSVNAIVADYANGIVNVIRIGRGSSRTVNLDGSGSSGGETPDVPDVPTGDFTNVLTEAGYSEGMRFSNSSLTDVEAASWDITGYILATRGDNVYMANVNFLDLDGTGGTSRAMIYLFDADKTYITCSANYDPNNLMSDAWSAVYGDDGDVVQFTLPTSYSSNVAYIRIGARNIDQYSVITVNEPIE